MAAGSLFGDYKIGGISNILCNKNESDCKESNTELLKSLFNKNSGSDGVTKINKQKMAIESTTKRSLARHHIDKEESKKDEGREVIVGVKRKQNEGGVTVEPGRKKQRENRKREVRSEKGESEDPKRLERTIFVGNIPLTATRKELKAFFAAYGKVESVRLRSVPVTKPEFSKKLAIVKKEFHSERTSMNGYVVFKEEIDTKKALEAKGSLFKGMHLRVDMATKKEVDNKLSVFIGNLPFNIQEEDVREHFSQCGDVDDVRIVRDKKTGIGKGFGYVAFKRKECVGFAIKLQNSELKGRKIRVFKSMDKSDARKPFNKKKDRKYRLKDVSSRRDNAVQVQKRRFPPNKQRNDGKGNKRSQKKGGKNFNKGSKRFNFKKGGAKPKTKN